MGKEIISKQINLPGLSTSLPDIVWGDSRFQFEVMEAPSAIDPLQIHAEFDSTVAKADKIDCLVAASSGVLAEALNIFWQKEFNLEDAHNWGKEKVDKFVIKVADLGRKRAGKNANITSLEQAIRYLEQEYPMASDKLTADFGGGLQHHLRDFTHHASIVGLFFSILSQFTHKGYGTNTDGEFCTFDLPVVEGRGFIERIIEGTFRWAMHLVSDMAGSSSNPGAGTGIPGPILSMLKDLSRRPFFHDLKISHDNDKIQFSQWVSKLFNGTWFKTEDGSPLRFDLRTEVGLFAQFNSQFKAVAINGAIVRTFYLLTRLKDEFERKNVRSISDLELLEPKAFMPHNSRALTRMLTIANSTFVGTNMTAAAIQAAVETGGTPAGVGYFFLRINYVGVARMGIAVYQDASYLTEDIGSLWENHFKRSTLKSEEIKVLHVEEVPSTEPSVIELTADSRRILTALQIASIEYDCWASDTLEEVALKQQWKRECLQTAQGVKQIEDGTALSEKLAYQQLANLTGSQEDRLQALLIAQELVAFTPYIQLGSEDDKEYKKLKTQADYISEVFLTSQTKITKETIKALKDSYSSSRRTLSGTVKKIVGGVAIVGFGGLITGGAGLLFAPELAVLLFGSAFVELSGAALTSASLAAAGGGALAAGGLGMAGGTAIIAGGAGALGLAGSSAFAFFSLMGEDSAQLVLENCVRTIALSRVAVGSDKQLAFVPRTASMGFGQKLQTVSEVEAYLKTAVKEQDNLKPEERKKIKKILKETKKIKQYLEKTISMLDELADNR